MALDLTKMAEANIMAKEQFMAFEKRLPGYGAFKAYLDGANALLPKGQIEGFKQQHNATPLSIPVLTKQTIPVLTARACDFTGQDASSAKPVIDSIWRGFAIKVYPFVHDNNMIGEREAFAMQLRNGISSVLANLDAYAVAQLEAHKNTDLETVSLDGISVVSNAYQVALAQKQLFYAYLSTMLERNDMGGSVIQDIANVESLFSYLYAQAQGMNADVNYQGIINGDLAGSTGLRHYRTKSIVPGAGVSETHYIAPFGSLGVFSWIGSQEASRMENLIDNKRMYPFTDSITGITWGVTEKPICEDLSATYGAGYEEVHGTVYRFLSSFAFMNAFSSDSSSPIVKVQLMTA